MKLHFEASFVVQILNPIQFLNDIKSKGLCEGVIDYSLLQVEYTKDAPITGEPDFSLAGRQKTVGFKDELEWRYIAKLKDIQTPDRNGEKLFSLNKKVSYLKRIS